MSNPIVIQHAFQSLRFAFEVLGPAQCQREIAILQAALADLEVAAAPALAAPAVAVPVKEDSLLTLLSPENVKTVVVPAEKKSKQQKKEKPADSSRAKWQREVIPDEQRCIQQLPNGKRCSFAQKDETEYCNRHIMIHLQQASEE